MPANAPAGADAHQAAAKFKAAAPAGAAALAIVIALVTGSLLTDGKNPAPQPVVSPVVSQPPVSQPKAAAGNNGGDQAPQPGTGLAGVQFDQAPGAAPGGVEIVVKFKDDSKVKDIIDTFWKNAPAAKAKFDAFKAGKPAFAGLKLDRVTYSNELVLVDAEGGAGPARIALMREIAAKLKTNPDISYADPNMTAHAGSQ